MSVTHRPVRAALGRHRLMVLALACVLLSVLLFRTEILSSLRWTGTAVHGSLSNGLVYYDYGGRSYTLNYASTLYSKTVYLNPRKPDDAVLGAPWSDNAGIAFVIAPLVIAVVLIYADLRQARARGEARAGSGRIGHGLYVGYIQRLNESRRNG